MIGCNIGATKAHALYSKLTGGYHKIYPTVLDFKIFQIDMNVILGKSDAFLIVNKLKMRKEMLRVSHLIQCSKKVN